MGFTASSGLLLKHLKNLSGVVVQNPVVPILENFLIEVGNGILRTTASDLQTTVIAELPVETQKQTQVAAPARMLIETLSNMPDQPITITVDEETYGLTLLTDNGKYRISGENPVDFPKLPKMANTNALDIPGSVMLRAIATTVFAASTEETRPAMGGVYFHLDTDQATFVATDGHRLVKLTRQDITVEEEVSFIMPRKALQYLKSSLPNDATDVQVLYTTNNACFSFGTTQIYCRLIDERFPDYQAAIPVQNPNQLVIDRQELISSLRRILLFTSKTNYQVRFKIAAAELTLSAEDADYSNDGTERIPCDYTGDPLEIGFNARILHELLSNINSTLVTIDLSTPNRPGIVMPRQQEESEKVLMLVMPIMLSSYVAA
jgi:DNA polymerase III subunit beta